MTDLRIFLAGIWKYYYHIWNQRPWVCLVAKFSEKTKVPKFGYFGAKILKNFYHIWNQRLRICPVVKFREKNENT